MTQPITITSQQDHERRHFPNGAVMDETPCIEVTVAFTPDREHAARALVELDGHVEHIRRGIAAYLHVGEGQR